MIAGLDPGEYLVDESGKIVQKVERNFPADLRANTAELGPAEKLKGPEASLTATAIAPGTRSMRRMDQPASIWWMIRACPSIT